MRVSGGKGAPADAVHVETGKTVTGRYFVITSNYIVVVALSLSWLVVIPFNCFTNKKLLNTRN